MPTLADIQLDVIQKMIIEEWDLICTVIFPWWEKDNVNNFLQVISNCSRTLGLSIPNHSNINKPVSLTSEQ